MTEFPPASRSDAGAGCMNDRPYILLATLDADTEPRWWIRLPDSDVVRYVDWLSIATNGPTRIVPPSRLTPVRADFCKFVGDPRAVAEVWGVRG